MKLFNRNLKRVKKSVRESSSFALEVENFPPGLDNFPPEPIDYEVLLIALLVKHGEQVIEMGLVNKIKEANTTKDRHIFINTVRSGGEIIVSIGREKPDHPHHYIENTFLEPWDKTAVIELTPIDDAQ